MFKDFTNTKRLLRRYPIVTKNEISPHHPRINVVRVSREKYLSIQGLQRFASIIFDLRAKINPIF
jgi:hypothetical protein